MALDSMWSQVRGCRAFPQQDLGPLAIRGDEQKEVARERLTLRWSLSRSYSSSNPFLTSAGLP